jgi:mRNA-degrading endonuclease toxin of MazEF toxin-antitoxin module
MVWITVTQEWIRMDIFTDIDLAGAILADQVRSLDWKARQAKKKSRASNEIIDERWH